MTAFVQDKNGALVNAGDCADELIAGRDRIAELTAELARSEANAKCGWQTANINEKARQEEMAKRDKAEAELAAVKDAVAAEREACAKICDCYTIDDDGKHDDARRCARAIRMQSQA